MKAIENKPNQFSVPYESLIIPCILRRHDYHELVPVTLEELEEWCSEDGEDDESE
jgi:hypothetical protein